ncbi:MAG: TVP38/TMEM64 family protein [Pseudomonadota bacterium]
MQPRRAGARAVAGIAVFGLVVLAGVTLAFSLDILPRSTAELEERLARLGPWGPAAIIGLMIGHSFVPFPAELVAIAAGVLYGPLWGTVYVWIGAMLGAALAFGLAKWLGRPFAERILSARQAQMLDRWTDDQGAVTLLVSRFIPVIAFNLINYAAGLTRIGWGTFLWTTAIGILPLTAMMVWMGSRMRDLSWPWLIVVAAVGIVAIAMLHAVARRRGWLPPR